MLDAASKEAFVASLGAIFEHAPWAVEAAAARRPFATVVALFDAMRDAVLAAPEAHRLTLVQGHPELAGRSAQAGTIAATSVAEQAAAGLDRRSEPRPRGSRC